MAIVAELLLLGLLLHPQLRESILGAEAAIRLAAIDQLPLVIGIDRAALAPAIGAEWATDVGAFVPRQPDPVQRIEDHLLRVGARAVLVGVLDPQYERAALLASKHVIEQCDVRRSHVWITGGRRCNPHTHRPCLSRHGGT